MTLLASNVMTRYGFSVDTAYIVIREVYQDFDLLSAKITYAIYGVDPELNSEAEIVDTMSVACNFDKFDEYFGDNVQAEQGNTTLSKAYEYLIVCLSATDL